MADHSDSTPPPNSPSDGSPAFSAFARMEGLLDHGRISDLHGVMRWGSNYAALVTVSDGDLKRTAVYKPQRGERPLWDFPDGTLCMREVMAYVISQATGWGLVPPTVLRDGPHGLGSLQLFIEHDPDVNYFSLDDSFVDQLRCYVLFDYVINNADRKGGHLLLDDKGKLWGIDHGLTFHSMPKLRTVIWEFAGQKVDAALLAPIQKMYERLLCADDDLRASIEKLLSAVEVTALIRRIKQLLDCQTYPTPGPGPNHPWPPV
ncbi:MAG TPA: SCO1664 family protein [Anaerolineales bacterium]|nr:SCO1664 family protein [Anaerolineales bacterium]